jgi:glycosyltransferase involved in cell wall biosynthesis
VLFFRGLCDTGGVSSWMLSLERELCARGVRSSFFFCQGSNRLVEFERVAPTTVAPIEVLLDLLATDAYDVVHIMGADPVAEILSLAPVRTRIVATNHGAPTDIWNSSNCLALTAVSQGIGRFEQPFTDLEVEAIYNGVDCERFTVAPGVESNAGDRAIVAWVGRTKSIEQKDFPRFLRVGRILADRGIRLWVADAHNAGPAFFEQRGDHVPPVERWEHLEYHAMPDFYRAVAASGGALLMTSPLEGFGLAAAEAAACGLTTVGPNVTGLQEVITPGLSGTLFPPKASDEEVADAVMRWLEAWHPERARNTASHARERFSAAKMADQYVEIYSRKEPRLHRGTWNAQQKRVSREHAEELPGNKDGRMFRQRIYALSSVALELSRSGRRRLALRAIMRLVSLAPRAMFRPGPRARIGGALLNLANPLNLRSRSRPGSSQSAS